MSRLRRSVPLVGVVAAGVLLAGCGSSNSPSMLDPKGSESRHIAGLWWLMFAIANLFSAPAMTLNVSVLLSMLLAVALMVTLPAALPVSDIVATPLTAFTLPSPVRLPLPVVWLNVTLPPKFVATLPLASFTVAV